jgi:uncharacterized protein YmfQ (DUF2313 family)
MISADLLKRLLPAGVYDANAALLGADLAADGAACDGAQGWAMRLIDEADPRVTSELLADWERVLGLPDSCAGSAAVTVSQRRNRVLDKLRKVRSQSRQFYLDLATQLGYSGVTITEFQPLACDDACDLPVYGEDWRFAWQMNTENALAVYEMRVGDPCDSPLRSWLSSELQCRLNSLKPAHTLVLINFGVA